MNVFYDANEIYEAGTKAIKSSPFKYGTQLYEMNHLLETAKIQEGMMNRTFKFDKGRKHVIKERGKARFITSDTMRVKSVSASSITCTSTTTGTEATRATSS